MTEQDGGRRTRMKVKGKRQKRKRRKRRKKRRRKRCTGRRISVQV